MSRRHPVPGLPPTLPFALLLLIVPDALAAPLTRQGSAPENDFRPRMERALALLSEGQLERAIPLLVSIVDDAPHHGPARLQLGALAVRRAEWEIAAEHLRVAVTTGGPEAPAGAVPVQRPGLAWSLLANALGQTGALEEALDATSRSLRFSPDFVPALLARSGFARRLASETAESDPARADRLETALEAAHRARDLLPDRPRPWTSLALAAHEAQISELAVCSARKAADLATDDPGASFLLARIAAESDPEAALVAAEAALAAGLRDEPALWMILGRLRIFRSDLDGSLAAYAEALRLDPGVVGEMESFALDAIAAGENPELLALLRERASSHPEALNARFALARADLRAGRTGSALAELRRLSAERADHAAILTALHAALRQTGDRTVAEVALARLASVKEAQEASWERANAAERARREAAAVAARGDFAGAARRWEALAAASGTASDLTELGHALRALGRHQDALAAFRRSLAARPFDPAALSAAADSARRASEPEEAGHYAARARLAADCGRFTGSGMVR